MVMMGTDGLDWDARRIDERLASGKWPKEARELRRLREEYQALLARCNEAGGRVSEYEKKLAKKLRIPPFPGGLLVILDGGLAQRPTPARRARRSGKSTASRHRS
jgi:hypothetical protein